MLDDREIRKEALIIVATFLFTMISQKFDVFNVIFNFFNNISNNSAFNGFASVISLFIVIPIVLFVISYAVISFIDSVIEWAKRNNILS